MNMDTLKRALKQTEYGRHLIETGKMDMECNHIADYNPDQSYFEFITEKGGDNE